MSFLRAGLTLGASTAVRLAAGLAAVKLVVIFTGASGLGQLGLFMSVMAVLSAVAGGGIVNGVTKRVAEVHSSVTALSPVLGTASSICIGWSALLALILFAAAEPIAVHLLHDREYISVMRWLAVGQAGMTCATLIGGYLNGRRLTFQYAALSIVSSVAGMAGVAGGAWLFGVSGAMVGLIWLNACPGLAMAAWALFALPREQLQAFRPMWSQPEARTLFKFSVMLAASALTLPLSQLFLQYLIEQRSGWEGVGYWQAAAKYCDTAVQFVGVVLASYYLPRLAESNGREQLLRLVREAYKYAIPLLAGFAVLSVVTSEQIILLLYSRDLLNAQPLFPWQVVGTVFKILAYIIGYICVAKASVRIYIFAEILQALLLCLLSMMLIPTLGPLGASVAYAATYLVYFCICFIVFRWYCGELRPATL